MKKVIDQKVYRLVPKGEYSFTLDKSKTYTITEVKTEEESKDWCKHYIIKADDGSTTEVREVDVIFVPDTSLPEADMVRKYLSDNHCYTDEVYTNGEGGVIVHIDWGDWKHDHGWCDTAMGYLGYACGGQIVTEENGSDCYSATHYFYKVA